MVEISSVFSFESLEWFLKEPFVFGLSGGRGAAAVRPRRHTRLLGRGVLGDGLGAFRHGVLGQLSGQQETDGRLDLAARDGRATVVVGQTRALSGDALEDVVDEAVHDRHGLRADAGVWVHLLQHLVDVDGVTLTSSPLLLLVAGASGLGLRRGLLRSFARRWLRGHFLVVS